MVDLHWFILKKNRRVAQWINDGQQSTGNQQDRIRELDEIGPEYWVILLGRRFQMSAKTVAHGREQLVLKICVATRTETRVKRRGQHRRGHAFINCGLHRPPAFARIGDASGKFRECGIFGERICRQIKQP